MAGDGQRLVAGRRGRCVFDLSTQVLHPVLQVLLVRTCHLQPLEHRPCGRRKKGNAGDKRAQSEMTGMFSSHPTVKLERVFVGVAVVEPGHRHAGQRQLTLHGEIIKKQNVKASYIVCIFFFYHICGCNTYIYIL